jgi:Ca2+-binding EF-hand superfamily protein
VLFHFLRETDVPLKSAECEKSKTRQQTPLRMGCTVSYQYTIDPNVVGRNQDCTDLLSSLSLGNTDLDILFTAFTDIDADDSGTIRFDELFAYFRIEPTKFNETVFGYCDADHRGYLTFLDFVIGVWLFLTVEKTELGAYAFILFDMDCTGLLDCEEIVNLIHIIHNKTTIQSQATLQVLEQLKLSKEFFTCDKFQEWTRTHLSLLEPVQTLQLNLRKNLIGDRYWQQKTEFRKVHAEYGHLARIYELKRKVYEIQKRQVLELIEERIILRRQDEFSQKKSPKGPRGQRTTALLEYFNFSKGDKNKTRERLGLNHQRKADHRPVKRRDPEQRYRAEDPDHDLSPRRDIENLPIPEGQESKEQESQKVSRRGSEPEWRFEFVDGKSSSSKEPGTGVSIKNLSPAISMEVHFKDILNCPEKQRRRRSSFLLKKPRLLLRSEKAHEEIKKKQKSGGNSHHHRKKGHKNKILPDLGGEGTIHSEG